MTTSGQPIYPDFPLSVTEALSEKNGMALESLSSSEARAVDAMVRHSLLIGWDACIASLNQHPDRISMISKRAELEAVLLGGGHD